MDAEPSHPSVIGLESRTSRSGDSIACPSVPARHEAGSIMNSIIYLIGLIVVVLAVLSLLGLS